MVRAGKPMFFNRNAGVYIPDTEGIKNGKIISKDTEMDFKI